MADLSVRAKIISDIVLIHNRTRRVERRLQNEDYGESELDKPFKYPEFYNAEIVDMGNFRMEVLKRNNASIDEWAVLQLHGGGYLSPFRNSYRTLAGLYSEAARGAMVVSVDYRVAPENPYPAAVDDALAAYLWILQAGYLPEKVIFGGDSAGGGPGGGGRWPGRSECLCAEGLPDPGGRRRGYRRWRGRRACRPHRETLL